MGKSGESPCLPPIADPGTSRLLVTPGRFSHRRGGVDGTRAGFLNHPPGLEGNPGGVVTYLPVVEGNFSVLMPNPSGVEGNFSILMPNLPGVEPNFPVLRSTPGGFPCPPAGGKPDFLKQSLDQRR